MIVCLKCNKEKKTTNGRESKNTPTDIFALVFLRLRVFRATLSPAKYAGRLYYIKRRNRNFKCRSRVACSPCAPNGRSKYALRQHGIKYAACAHDKHGKLSTKFVKERAAPSACVRGDKRRPK